MSKDNITSIDKNFCKCGCGTEIKFRDVKNRPVNYVRGHNTLKYKRYDDPDVLISCACGCGLSINPVDKQGRAVKYKKGHGSQLRNPMRIIARKLGVEYMTTTELIGFCYELAEAIQVMRDDEKLAQEWAQDMFNELKQKDERIRELEDTLMELYPGLTFEPQL